VQHRARQLAFPAIEFAREAKQPIRGRYAAARAGQALDPLPARGRRWMLRHPLGTLQRIIGEPRRKGPIWAVTMVKNEEVRVAGAVQQLFDGGVDVVVVADNLSTDATADVLADLAERLPVIIVRDDEPAYYQGPKMSRLARAAARNGASWIVPFDADELWFGIGEPLSERLRLLAGDAASAAMYDFLPEPGRCDSTDPYREMTRRTIAPVTRKTAFRAHLLATIATGNHWVQQPVRVVSDALAVRHYPFLGFDHFVQKAVQGGAALAATSLPRNVGEHWRDWADAPDLQRRRMWGELVARDTCIDPLPTVPYLQSSSLAQP